MEQEQPIEAPIKESANEIAAAIDRALNAQPSDDGRKWGFALLMFKLGDNHTADRMNYISNSVREDMLTAMKEFIARAEGRYYGDPTKRQ